MVKQMEIDAVVMPVSGYVRKNGDALIGGISKLLVSRFYGLEDKTGKALTQSNGLVCCVGEFDGVQVIAFPDRPDPNDLMKYTGDFVCEPGQIVKGQHANFVGKRLSEVPRWALVPSLEQLEMSCHQLMALRNKEQWQRVALLRPSYPIPFDSVKQRMGRILATDHFALITMKGTTP